MSGPTQSQTRGRAGGWRRRLLWAGCLGGATLAATPLPAASPQLAPPVAPAQAPAPLPALPAPAAEVVPVVVPALTRDEAVRLALEVNPEIAALRQQHGIAAANIVIARTYPFNPLFESRVRYGNGPVDATVAVE